jgi:hypothetical protein
MFQRKVPSRQGNDPSSWRQRHLVCPGLGKILCVTWGNDSEVFVLFDNLMLSNSSKHD